MGAQTRANLTGAVHVSQSTKLVYALNETGFGDPPPHQTDGFWLLLAPSSVVRFMQTQNLIRSKLVDLNDLIFFVGFPFTILVVRLIL